MTSTCSSSGSESNEENVEFIRCKWQGDGAKTLDELIEKMRSFIEYIEILKEDGWELVSPMDDDWGHLERRVPT